jgi:hypothetical protein
MYSGRSMKTPLLVALLFVVCANSYASVVTLRGIPNQTYKTRGLTYTADSGGIITVDNKVLGVTRFDVSDLVDNGTTIIGDTTCKLAECLPLNGRKLAGSIKFLDGSTQSVALGRNADSFVGSTIGDRIDAACNSFSGAFGIVLVPPGASAGGSTIGLLDNCIEMDLRGLGIFDYRGSVFSNPYDARFSIYRRHTAARTNANDAHKNVLSITGEPWTGGVNTAVKSEYEVLSIYQANHTDGQHSALSIQDSSAAGGDTIAVNAQALGTGNCLVASGDEGCIGIRGLSQEATATFSGTVSSVVGSVVKYNSPSNEGERAEGRYLIVTNRGTYTTGAVTAIAGTPPVFTGTGTGWLSLCVDGIACSPSNLFIEITGSNTASADKYIFKVNSVASDTSLTLRTITSASDHSWLGDNATCTGGAPCGYTIYLGATITALGNSGTVTVDTPASFQAADSIISPLGTAQSRRAIRAIVAQTLPSITDGNGIAVTNVGPRRIAQGIGLDGDFDKGIQFSNMPHTYGIYFTDPSGTAPAPGQVIYVNDQLTNNTVILARINRNSGNADLTYSKNGDFWSMGCLRWDGDLTDPRAALGNSVNPQANTTLHIKPKDSSATGIVIDGSVTTSMICYNTAKTVCDFVGTGSPETVVTASVGSTFRRTDGGAGTTFYVKESGTAATGWIGK